MIAANHSYSVRSKLNLITLWTYAHIDLGGAEQKY